MSIHLFDREVFHLLGKRKKWNTLRNQIFINFISVMVVVLLFVGFITFNLVMDILKGNAEKQMEQTAIETLHRVDSQFEAIEMIMSQIATNGSIQQLLYNEANGHPTTFEQRQSMNQVINSYQAYITGITSFELYFTDYRRLFPLNELPLPSRIRYEWIEMALEENGRVVWSGIDPLDADSFLTLKKVNLLDQGFSHGGYLVSKVNTNYFELRQENGQLDMDNQYVALFDQQGQFITTNMPEEWHDQIAPKTDKQVVTMDGTDYVRVEAASNKTGWSLLIYTPVHSLAQGITGIGTAILVAGGIGLLIFTISTYFLSSLITNPIQRLTHAMRFGTLGALKESPSIASTVELNELNDTYNRMVETTNYLIKVVYEQELTQSRAELKALQSQINPHFLFNTLEALYWSLEEKDEEQAEVVIALAELFRYTISDVKGDDWVALHEEFDHIERYLHIMKLRYDHRLAWEIELDPLLREVQIPKLLIQPVVENAIIHGIGNKVDGGKVQVSAYTSVKQGYVNITVRDDGQGMDEKTKQKLEHSLETRVGHPEKRSGIALVNIRQRLDLCYASDPHTSIELTSRHGVGTTVTFTIPKKEAPSDEATNGPDRR